MNKLPFTIDAQVLHNLSEGSLSEADKQEMIGMQCIFFIESLFWIMSNHASVLATSDGETNLDETFHAFQNLCELGAAISNSLSNPIQLLERIADSPAIKVPTFKSVEAGNLLNALRGFSEDFSLITPELQKKAARRFAEFWKEFKETEVIKSEQS